LSPSPHRWIRPCIWVCELRTRVGVLKTEEIAVWTANISRAVALRRCVHKMPCSLFLLVLGLTGRHGGRWVDAGPFGFRRAPPAQKNQRLPHESPAAHGKCLTRLGLYSKQQPCTTASCTTVYYATTKQRATKRRRVGAVVSHLPLSPDPTVRRRLAASACSWLECFSV